MIDQWKKEQINTVMEWMSNTQLGRRNFLSAQKIYVVDKIQRVDPETCKNVRCLE